MEIDDSFEMWIDIKDFEDKYQVSNLGNLRRKAFVTKEKTGKVKFNKEKYIHPYIKEDGRRFYTFNNGANKVNVGLNRIVMLHFNPMSQSKSDLLVVNHKNGNVRDNNIMNLEWCTKKENSQHAYDVGLNPSWGEGSGKSKIDEMQALAILTLVNHKTQQYIADRMGISRSCVMHIKNGISWKHLPRTQI